MKNLLLLLLLLPALAAAKIAVVRVIEVAQGQKVSRLVAWTFQPLAQQQAWSRFRWG